MGVLVDTSVWIDYFRGGGRSSDLEFLIDENIVLTNDLILAELLPYLRLKNETKVIELMSQINRLPMTIDWGEIIDFQVKCLNEGANGIGIPDLLIAQNAMVNKVTVYSLDKYFKLMNRVLGVALH